MSYEIDAVNRDDVKGWEILLELLRNEQDEQVEKTIEVDKTHNYYHLCISL